MKLKELRKRCKMSQASCAEFLGIPLRTYQDYENKPSMCNSLKYKYMVEQLENRLFVDETHGILSIDDIKNSCAKIFDRYNVEYCYLFGSYSMGTATETSDVDLLIRTDASGIQFFELIEDIRDVLRKNIDLLGFEQLSGNSNLMNEVLKDGIKIYEKTKSTGN